MLTVGGEIGASSWEEQMAAAAILEGIDPQKLGLEPDAVRRVAALCRLAQESLGAWANDCAAEWLKGDAHA